MAQIEKMHKTCPQAVLNLFSLPGRGGGELQIATLVTYIIQPTEFKRVVNFPKLDPRTGWSVDHLVT